VTAQVPDEVMWDGRSWTLAGFDGSGLFDPTEHGLEPIMLSTANWRGFVCEYAVVDDRLVLDRLKVGLPDEVAAAAQRGEASQVNGRRPTRRVGIESTYEDLALPIPFTGMLTLGDEFIQDLYVHMGYQPAWKYRRVAELRFEAGALVSAEDASERYTAMREEFGGRDIRPRRDSPLDVIRDWIARAFDRTDRDRLPRDRDDRGGTP
jgi:hypothetical protein